MVLKVSIKIVLGTLFILGSFFSKSGNAQEVKPLKFGMFISPGINWMKTSSEGINGSGTTWGFNYGLITDFAISDAKPYYISTGINILSIGGKIQSAGAEVYNNTLVETIDNQSITTRYLEIPFALKMRSSEIGYSYIAGLFGIGTGFKLGAQQDRDTEYYPITGRVDESFSKEDIGSSIRAVRMALLIGFDWERQITGDTYLILGLRFSNGLTNVLKGDGYAVDVNNETDLSLNYSDGSPKGDPLKANSRVLSFQLGILF